MQQETLTAPHHPMEVTIRRAVEADAAPLAKFMAALVAERLPVLYARDRGPSVEEEVEFIRQMNRTARSVLLVAYVGGELVGMLDFHGHPKLERSHAGEFGMSVAERWRGTGIGSRLVDHLLRWAPGEGLRRIELSVFSNNSAAIALYERSGFVREGVQHDAVQVEGRFVDIVMMARLVR